MRAPRNFSKAHIIPVYSNTAYLDDNNGIGVPLGPYPICSMSSDGLMRGLSEIALMEVRGEEYGRTELDYMSNSSVLTALDDSSAVFFAGFCSPPQLSPARSFMCVDDVVSAAARHVSRLVKHQGLYRQVCCAQPSAINVDLTVLAKSFPKTIV